MAEEERTLKTPAGSLQLVLDDDVAQGTYSNFQVVASNETEFVIDFAYLPPGSTRGRVRSRVILSPKHAKALLSTIGQRVRDHESRFGVIPPPTSVLLKGGGGGSGLPN